MVKVSVNLGSARPGGVDVLLNGLVSQTFQDFEVIFVDARYHKRHAEVLDYVKKVDLKQPLYHVPNYRYNWEWAIPCCGRNTGIMLSEGELVVMLADYAYVSPNWLEEHVKCHTQPRYVVGPHITYTGIYIKTKNGEPPKLFPAPNHNIKLEDILQQMDNFDEISTFDISQLKDGVLNPWPPNDKTGPRNHPIVNTKNDSFPLDIALKVGGLHELHDSTPGAADKEFCGMIQGQGCEVFFCREAEVRIIDVREIMPKTTLAIPEPACGDPACKSCSLARQYNVRGWCGTDGLEPNNFDIYERRKEIWHWRELSKEREAVIPYNNIPNPEYFKKKA